MVPDGFENPSDAEIRDLLTKVRTIAVVGLSDNPDRPSHGVASALKAFGYRVIPVNPKVESVFGEKSVASLSEIDARVDLVDVFRDPRHVPGIVSECLELKLPALWLQEGVVHRESADRAREAGMTVVMDRCIYKESKRLFPEKT